MWSCTSTDALVTALPAVYALQAIDTEGHWEPSQQAIKLGPLAAMLKCSEVLKVGGPGIQRTSVNSLGPKNRGRRT